MGQPAPQNENSGDKNRKQSATAELKQETFEPKTVSIAVGGTVTWENTTDTSHRITSHRYQSNATEWEFPKSPIEPGATVEHTFEEAGLYQYYSITGGGRYSMCGTIVVGDAPEPNTTC